MRNRLVIISLIVISSIGIVGCGKEKKEGINTEIVEEMVTEVVEEKDVPFETVNVLDYSKIGDVTYLIIGDSFSNCKKYDIDIEQTYLEAMMDSKSYISGVRVKFGHKVENNKNEDLYNTDDIGTVLDNREQIQVGSIIDWEFYDDNKSLGKMDLTEMTNYVKEKYKLPRTEEEETEYTLTTKSVETIVDASTNIQYLKIVDENNFVFYDFRMAITEGDYPIGISKTVKLIYNDEILTETNPLTQTYLIISWSEDEENNENKE